jgi:hypothetical protein
VRPRPPWRHQAQTHRRRSAGIGGGHRGTTDQDFDRIAHACLNQSLDGGLHLDHGGRQQRTHADHRRLVLADRPDEPLGRNVCPQVDGVKTGTLQHHPYQVLADVVLVSFDGANDELAGAGGLTRSQQRPQDSHAGVHGTCRNQHLRHKQLAGLKVAAHLVHAGNQAALQDLAGAQSLFERRRNKRGHLFVLALVQPGGDRLQNRSHRLSLLALPSRAGCRLAQAAAWLCSVRRPAILYSLWTGSSSTADLHSGPRQSLLSAPMGRGPPLSRG